MDLDLAGGGVGGGCWQDVLSQWQFVFIRRQVEKGSYYHECNQLCDTEEDVDVKGSLENPKVLRAKSARGYHCLAWCTDCSPFREKL
jgi:hypothetical protein